MCDVCKSEIITFNIGFNPVVSMDVCIYMLHFTALFSRYKVYDLKEMNRVILGDVLVHSGKKSALNVGGEAKN